jgi:hypothetical protein
MIGPCGGIGCAIDAGGGGGDLVPKLSGAAPIQMILRLLAQLIQSVLCESNLEPY